MGRVVQCCCFSLKTGSMIIATLGWTAKIFGLIGGAPGGSNSQQSHSDEQGNISAAIHTCKVVHVIISLICCFFLVVGIYKRNANYFIPWLIIDCLERIACTIITVVCFVYIFIVPNPDNIFLAVMFVILVGVSALTWYFWVVVYSFYQEVKSEVIHVPAEDNISHSRISV